MSVSLTINGVSYDYPTTGDIQWGADATAWASAVTSGMLQKAGGLFQLLAEVDFGTSYGIKSLYYSSRTANIASAGQIRLARADVISFRNEANLADLDLGVNSSNVLTFNGVAVGNFVTVSDTSTIDLTLSAGDLSAAIVAGSITNSLINASAAIDFSKLAALSSGNILVGSAGNVATSVAMSGDATISNTGVLTIANNAVSNAKLAQMATLTIKGNNTGGNADPLDLTSTQVTAMLDNFVGDSGSGGTKGLVPAPAAGDAAADKFLKADGTWTTPAGAGDVVGPAGATDNALARFDLATGKIIKNSIAILTDPGALSGLTEYTSSGTGSSNTMTLSHNGSGDSLHVSHSGSGEAIHVNSGSLRLTPLTASRALVLDANKRITASSTTDTQIGYLSTTTSDIQVQLDAKQARSTVTTKGDLYAASASATTDRLPAGTNGYVLRANSGQTLGLEYALPSNQSDTLVNCTISASVAANALTIALKTNAGTDPSSTDPIFVAFRNATLTTPTYTVIAITSALSITVPSGATLGTRNGVESDVYVGLLNNAGTPELFVGRIKRREDRLISTTAIDTASDSGTVLYSGSARTNVAFRLIGIVTSTQATAGTWATSPSAVFSGKRSAMPLQQINVTANLNSLTLNNDTTTTVIFNSVNNDPLGLYNTSTGEITIPEDMDFSCFFNFTLQGTSAFNGTTEQFYAFIYIDASVATRFFYYPTSTSFEKGINVSANRYATRGQVITCRAYQNSGSNLPIVANGAFTYVNFNGVL